MRGARYFDAAAEALPRRELESLQMERVRACVERLRGSAHPFDRKRLSAVRVSGTLPRSEGKAVRVVDGRERR